MIFWTIFIAVAISLVFFVFKGFNRGNNQINPSSENKNNLLGHTINSKVNKYTTLKAFLEKSFANKREKKSKFHLYHSYF